MVYLLMEFGSKGTLFDLLSLRQKEGKVFDETEIIQLILTISKSVKKMHELGYQHRDLKIENLLYFSDEVIKLCDFGSVS
jgi:serine/threonine protein kinase